jgi:hypothetical protein
VLQKGWVAESHSGEHLGISGRRPHRLRSSSFRVTANSDISHDPSLTPVAPHPLIVLVSSVLHSNLGAFIGLGGFLVGLFELSRTSDAPSFSVQLKEREPYCHAAEVFFQQQEQPEGRVATEACDPRGVCLPRASFCTALWWLAL